jgi:hypothetical protein
MQSYRSILTGIHALIAVIFGLTVSQQAWFFAYDPQYGRYLFIGALFLLFFLFRYSYIFSDLIIEKIPGVSPALRRLIAGEACIEGDWPLVVMIEDPMTKAAAVGYIGYLTITYKGGQYQVSGSDWTPSGTFVLNFSSQQCRLAGNVLQYWYHQGENDVMRGYTEMHFFPKDGPFERHAGEFIDKQHNAARFYARRFKYGIGGVKRPRSEKERIAAALAFWDSIKADINTIYHRPLSADWE